MHRAGGEAGCSDPLRPWHCGGAFQQLAPRGDAPKGQKERVDHVANLEPKLLMPPRSLDPFPRKPLAPSARTTMLAMMIMMMAFIINVMDAEF